MANEEQLAILRQGVDVWNRWRAEHPNAELDLRGADLQGAKLYQADLHEANLQGADLREAILVRADLHQANLQRADLQAVNLHGANLQGAILENVILVEGNLERAILQGANLQKGMLVGVSFQGAHLHATDLTHGVVGNTIFGNVDLRGACGLDTLQHLTPSTIGIDTIYRSQGDIPEVFLRNAGVPDTFIEYMRSLTIRPIEYYSCFISYSSTDQDCAERLHTDLRSKGVRCWFAPHDLPIGKPIVHGIDEAIRLYDKLLLILSESSVNSGWVEFEVTMALTRENAERRMMLFPIRLDDAVLHATNGWAMQLQSRHIGDFRGWKTHDTYQTALTQLMRDLTAHDQSK